MSRAGSYLSPIFLPKNRDFYENHIWKKFPLIYPCWRVSFFKNSQSCLTYDFYWVSHQNCKSCLSYDFYWVSHQNCKSCGTKRQRKQHSANVKLERCNWHAINIRACNHAKYSIHLKTIFAIYGAWKECLNLASSVTSTIRNLVTQGCPSKRIYATNTLIFVTQWLSIKENLCHQYSNFRNTRVSTKKDLCHQYSNFRK
jgi:hypothetical protein